MADRFAEVTIHALTSKGNGLGSFTRADGVQVSAEVPFTMPGDKVKVRLLSKRKGRYQSHLQEVLVPAPQRIQPRCVHFGTCGGCRFQHLTYEDQLKYKENRVRQYFGDLLTPEVDFRPIIGCKEPWEYRNKMEYSFSSDAAKNQYLGLVIEGSRGKVFNLTECHLSPHWFVEAVQKVRSWWQESGLDAYHMHKDTGSLRTLMLREGRKSGDRMAVLTVSGNAAFALGKYHLKTLVACLKETIETANNVLTIFLRIQQIGKGRATNFFEMLLHGPGYIREELPIQIDPQQAPNLVNFQISPAAFFQPNAAQAPLLYSTALRLAEAKPEDVVYDLYCGIGVLGICLAHRVKQVVGIELSPEAILDARANAASNDCKNTIFFCGAMRAMLQQLKDKQVPSPDLVLVDPPRAGMDADTVSQLIALRPPKILFVSCEPANQVKNVAELAQHGYKLKLVQPVDQFPQTYHIENIVLLTHSS